MSPNYDDYSYDKDSWEHMAMPTLWRSEENPDIPMDIIPSVGRSYRINVSNGNLKNGQTIKAEYLPPFTFVNGFEPESDISRVRICVGTLSDVGHRKDIDDLYKSYSQDAVIIVENTISIEDFAKLSQHKTFTLGWEDELHGRCDLTNFFSNKGYIVWNWNRQGYIGETYILIEQNGQFYAIYGGHAEGATDCSFGGKVKLPEKLTNLFRERIRNL